MGGQEQCLTHQPDMRALVERSNRLFARAIQIEQVGKRTSQRLKDLQQRSEAAMVMADQLEQWRPS